MPKQIVTITVLELIARLGELPLEAPVLISTDENEKEDHFAGVGKLELDASGNVLLYPHKPSTTSDSML